MIKYLYEFRWKFEGDKLNLTQVLNIQMWWITTDKTVYDKRQIYTVAPVI